MSSFLRIFGLALFLGSVPAVVGQLAPPSVPALPPTIPPAILPGGGGAAPEGANSKLDGALQAALRQSANPGANVIEVLKGLNLDVDSRIRVLVEIEFRGSANLLETRIEELRGLILRSRLGAGGMRARLGLRQIPILAEERFVIRIGAVGAIAAAVPPTQDITTVVRELPAQALQAIRAALTEKQTRSAAQKKMDTGLLIAAKRSQNLAVADGALARVQPSLTRDNQQRVLVDLALRNVDASAIAQVRALGGTVTSRVDRFRSVQAWMPVARLERLAEHGSIRAITRALLPITRVHKRSEGDIRHRTDIIRNDFGFDGTEVKVGVLSNGVDTLASSQGNGDLPNEIVVLPGQRGSGDEGTAILEIVNDLAPGAELMFASGFPSEAQMAQNILDLAAAGCDVIVDDVGHLLAPVFQDGPAAQAVETVFQQGVAYFSAAGNAGNFDGGTSGMWEGDFVAAELTVGDETFVVHDFGAGITFNELRSDPASVIALQWADPVGAAANDYDLMLLDESGTEIVAISNNVQDGSGNPLEFIDSRLDDHAFYRIVIVRSSGEDRYLRLDTFGSEIEFVTSGQVFGHPAAENAIAIGAVFQGNGVFGPGYFDGDEPVESFSSDGSRRMFFSANGEPYTPANFSASGGVVREKPNFVAADGVSTNTPFFEQFFGTSAAAPHAAAIGALLKQRGVMDPSLIRHLFESTAIDVETPGFDRKSGHGIVDAFKVMLSPLAMDDALVRPFESVIVLDEMALISNDQSGIGAGALSLPDGSGTTDQGGTFTVENGLVEYRPKGGFRGVDRFDYVVSEAGSSTITASVHITVEDPPPAPLSLSIAGWSDGALTLEISGNSGQLVYVDHTSMLEGVPSWNEIESVTLDAGGLLSIEIEVPTEIGFLRLRSL